MLHTGWRFPGAEQLVSKEKKIKVTPFQASDLGLELEFGLKTMQLGRILRLIEEAYGQDSLIDAKQLSLLCNITPPHPYALDFRM